MSEDLDHVDDRIRTLRKHHSERAQAHRRRSRWWFVVFLLATAVALWAALGSLLLP